MEQMLTISIDSTVIAEALKITMSLAPPMTGNVIIGTRNKALILTSIGENNRVEFRLPCTVKGEGTFALPIDTLTSSTRGRDTLTMRFANDVLYIQSGRYSAKLPTVDVIQEDAQPRKIENWMKVTADQGQWLKEALADVNLAPTTVFAQSAMPVAVSLTPEGAFVCCYDSGHFAYTTSNEVTGNFELTLPISLFSAVIGAFAEADFKMAFDGRVLVLSNPVIKAEVATMAVTAMPIDQLAAQIETLSSMKPEAEFSIDVAEVKAFLANSQAINNKESRNALRMTINKNSADLSVSSDRGEASIQVEAQSTRPIHLEVDQEYFGEMLSKNLPEFGYYGRFLFGRDEDFGMMLGLNQIQGGQ